VAHWLVVIPFYFFSAIATFLVLALACRVVRAKIGANALAIVSVILAVGVVAVPLALDWIDVAHLNGRRLLALVVATVVLAAIDTLLQPVLPLPADRDLAEF
jgi:uncharacterized membrane protein YagU involved in acid resistance